MPVQHAENATTAELCTQVNFESKEIKRALFNWISKSRLKVTRKKISNNTKEMVFYVPLVNFGMPPQSSCLYNLPQIL